MGIGSLPLPRKGIVMKELACKRLCEPDCVACKLIQDAKISSEFSELDIKDIVNQLIEIGWKKVF